MAPNKPFDRMRRRNFLRALLGLGVSTSMVGAYSREGLATLEFDPETEVPRLHGYRHTNHEEMVEQGAPPEREPIYEEIPREKWRLVEAADDVRARVQQRLSDLEPTPPVALRVLEGEDDMSHRSVVVKHVTEVTNRGRGREVVAEPAYSARELSEVVKDRFPDEMSGVAGRGTNAESVVDEVPVLTESVRAGQNSSYDYEYRSEGVPSGCVIEGDYWNDRGTLGALVFDGDTYRYSYVTAGHVVRDSEEVYQNDRNQDDNHLASVNEQKKRIEWSFDVAVLWGIQIGGAWKFAANGENEYHGPEIAGAQSRQGLVDMQGTDKKVRKQGITTGIQRAKIDDVYDTSYDANHDGEDGDSGGPHWVEKSGDALISGIHRGPKDEIMGDEYGSHATIVESIEDEYNLIV